MPQPKLNGGWIRAKVLVVLGTRPEVIKLSPVVRALERDHHFEVVVCVVAQQGELLEQSLVEWGLTAQHRISIPQSDRRLASTLAAMLSPLADIMEMERPSMVLVEGDTTTNLGAALAAFYAGVPVGHVEAGLRSGDRSQPFPEEMHRVLVDRIASVHYAPTEGARQNLLAENGLNPSHIVLSGNTVVDALRAAARKDELDGTAASGAKSANGKKMLLVTAHRRESFGPGIESICGAVAELARRRSDLEVVFVLHSNPAARLPAEVALQHLPNVQLIEPQTYLSFIRLLSRAHVVLTDSGGVQEEAPYLGTPVLVTREITERPEASDAGAARIVGTDRAAIIEAVTQLLDDAELHSAMAQRIAPYGDGYSAARIHADLISATRLRGRAKSRGVASAGWQRRCRRDHGRTGHCGSSNRDWWRSL